MAGVVITQSVAGFRAAFTLINELISVVDL